MTVSRYDPQRATPGAHVAELGTKLCDSAWFASQFDPGWRETAPGLWTLEFGYTRSGWFSTSTQPAVGVLRFDPARGVVVGVWAKDGIYSAAGATAVAADAAASVGGAQPR